MAHRLHGVHGQMLPYHLYLRWIAGNLPQVITQGEDNFHASANRLAIDLFADKLRNLKGRLQGAAA